MIMAQFPDFVEHLEDVWPAKEKMTQSKVKGEAYLAFYLINDEIMFFQERDGPVIPVLKILHKCKV